MSIPFLVTCIVCAFVLGIVAGYLSRDKDL